MLKYDKYIIDISDEIIISTAACGHDIYGPVIPLLKSVVTLSRSRLHLIILTDALKDNIINEVKHKIYIFY